MRQLTQLALSDEGFVFDPHTGDSYQVSETGLHMLKSLKLGRSDEAAAEALVKEFDVTIEEARHDCADFRSRLRNLGLA